MLRKVGIFVGLLLTSTALTAFSGSLQEAEPGKGGIPLWVWLLIVLIIVLLIIWWLWRRTGRAAAPRVARAREAPVTAKPTAPAPTAPPAVTAAPAPEPTPPAEPDDLTHIEGIGPKISSLLQAAGITTFAKLAETDVSRLQAILDEAGLRIGFPDTWPEQARLAADGQWDELEALQSKLEGGRRV